MNEDVKMNGTRKSLNKAEKYKKYKSRIDKIFRIQKKVYKTLLTAALPFFIVSITIVAVFSLFINPLPKVTDDNIIREYIPSICDFYSLDIDDNGNFYIHTSLCIMRYDAKWNYQYSYIFSSPRRAVEVLSIDNNMLHLENSVHDVVISDSGLLKRIEKKEPSSTHRNRNLKVKNIMGQTFTLVNTGVLFPKVYDEAGRIVWHCPYFSFAAFYCCLISTFCSFFFFIRYFIATRDPSEVYPYKYFYK